MELSASAVILGLLYILGACAFWNNIETKEMLLSQHLKTPVRMIPWQRTLACAIWPLATLGLLLNSNGDNKNDNDE